MATVRSGALACRRPLQSERASEALPLIEPFRELIEREGPVEQRMKFWSDYAYVLNSARRLRRTADALVRRSRPRVWQATSASRQP